MAEGKTYNIPAARFDWFKEQIEKLGRKAMKLNGERLFLTKVGFHLDEDRASRWFGQRIMEVFVACPEPKLDGWEFVARIDHANEAGNIVRTTGLRDLPQEYRHSDPSCDHCGHKRRRRDTFVVFHDDHGFKQVGSSCLKDFLGHGDADRIAKLSELLASIRGFAHGSFEGDAIGDKRFYPTELFLEYAAEVVLKYGFVSKKMERETGKDSTSSISTIYFHACRPVSQQAKDLARAALDWAINLDETESELNDYLHNCWVVANAPGLEDRTLGIAASIVGVYHRNQTKTSQVSNHIGHVGDKVELLLKVVETRLLDSGSTLNVLTDSTGNVLKWFSSNAGFARKRGQTIRVVGTVKAHGAYKGVAETILTRCKEA